MVVITEDGVHGHPNLARHAFAPEPFDGSLITFSRTVAMDPAWDLSNIVLVVYAETVGGEVLQACKGTPNYAGNVAIDAEPDGVDAPWQLVGPDGFAHSGSGDLTMPVFGPGEYTLTWLDVPGWTTPDPVVQNATLAQGETIDFAGSSAFAAPSPCSPSARWPTRAPQPA